MLNNLINHQLSNLVKNTAFLRQTLFCSVLFGMTFALAQETPPQEPLAKDTTAQTATISDYCLGPIQTQQDSQFTELNQFDSQHAAMVYQYTSAKVNQWLGFGDYLETAIHESNHHLNRVLSRECEPLNNRKYFLIGHVYETDLQVGETPSISIINQTAPPEQQSSSRYGLYISANPNVHRNTFSSLLDEFTAYTGEAWIHLKKVESPPLNQTLNYSQFQIDGMVNFMLYFQAYLKSARLYYPDAYEEIKSQDKTIAYANLLWQQAETILLESYSHIEADRAAQHFFYRSDGLASAVQHLNHIYTVDMLSELDLLNINHLEYSNIQNTFLK